MKAMKVGSVGIIAVSFLICVLSNNVLAYNNFRGGFGGGSYSHHGHGYYDQDYYGYDYYGSSLHHGFYRPVFPYRGHHYYSNYDCEIIIYQSAPRIIIEEPPIIIYQSAPRIIIEEPPIVIYQPAPPIVVKEQAVIIQPYEKGNEEALKILRQKRIDLLKKLETGNKDERKEAIFELAGFCYDTEVKESLEKILLSDPDPELRKEVAKSFAKSKNREVLPVLEKARIEDPDAEVRKESDRAIKEIET